MSKYFNTNNPTQIVTIVADHTTFLQLSDGNMIKKESFESKYQPVLEGFEHEHIPTQPVYNPNVDYINPDSFFNTSAIIDTTDIEMLKNTNTSNISEFEGVNRTQIVNKLDNGFSNQTNTLNEGILTPIKKGEEIIPNNTNIDVSQYKVYDNDDDAYADFINKTEKPKIQQPQQSQHKIQMDEINSLYEDEKLVYGDAEATSRKNKRINKLSPQQETNQETNQESIQGQDAYIQQSPGYTPPTMDPITMMFSTFKRSHEVVFNVQFKDKVANPEFVKMMIENMDGDIIGFYKKSIMNNIMKNLSVIETVVESELRQVLGVEEIIENNNETPSLPIEVKKEKPIDSTPKKPRKTYTKKTK